VQARLVTMGSTLTSDQVLNRATAASCAGCHVSAGGADLGGGLGTWSSPAFRHVMRSSGAMHSLSSALTQTFLPHRARVLEDKLHEHCAPPPTSQAIPKMSALPTGTHGQSQAAH
jgi:hypothetical protein